MPGEHAKFGPSSSEQWLNCPAWGRLNEGLTQDESAAMADGTRQHKLAESHLLKHTEPEVGKDADVIQPYIEHCRTLQKQGRTQYVETRVAIEGPDCWGTLDGAHVDPLYPSIDVSDLKTGAGTPVDAEENTQLMLYAIGMLKLHAGKPKDWPTWTVRLHIIQPRRRDGKPNVDTWQTTGAYLATFYKQVKTMLRVQANPNAQPAAGGHCHWCKASATCPARLKQAASIFPILDAEGPTDLPIPKPVNAAALDAPTLTRVWELADQIRSWLKSVDAEIMRRGGIEGHVKIVEGKANRAWKDTAEATAKWLEANGVQPHTKKLIGIPEAELMLKALGLPMDPTLVGKPLGKPTLTEWDDKRPAFKPEGAFPLDTNDDEIH